MKSLLLLSLLIWFQPLYFGQVDSLKTIDQFVEKIDSDQILKPKEFDAAEIYNRAFDGGGVIRVFKNQTELKKIEQEIGLSFGLITTRIYFDDGRVIKIIDTEENYRWKGDNTGWDYSAMNQVFKADIYVFDWDLDRVKIVREGQRNLSEGTCSIFEYEPLIELGYELSKLK